MEFFSKLGETISVAGRDVSQKAKDLTETTRMSMDIKAKEDYICKQYASMGEKYYEMHQDDDEPLFEEIALIREARAEVARMKDQLAEKKGMKRCPVCQASMDQDAQYCPSCGAKYETPYEEE
jgi:rubrerythrin